MVLMLLTNLFMNSKALLQVKGITAYAKFGQTSQKSWK
jgi:hypothetical protein